MGLHGWEMNPGSLAYEAGPIPLYLAMMHACIALFRLYSITMAMITYTDYEYKKSLPMVGKQKFIRI